MVFGRELRLRLSVLNTGEEAFLFEEALHTYFAVGDATRVSLTGLEGTEYLDKTQGFARKREEGPTLTFQGEPIARTSTPPRKSFFRMQRSHAASR